MRIKSIATTQPVVQGKDLQRGDVFCHQATSPHGYGSEARIKCDDGGTAFYLKTGRVGDASSNSHYILLDAELTVAPLTGDKT